MCWQQQEACKFGNVLGCAGREKHQVDTPQIGQTFTGQAQQVAP